MIVLFQGILLIHFLTSEVLSNSDPLTQSTVPLNLHDFTVSILNVSRQQGDFITSPSHISQLVESTDHMETVYAPAFSMPRDNMNFSLFPENENASNNFVSKAVDGDIPYLSDEYASKIIESVQNNSSHSSIEFSHVSDENVTKTENKGKLRSLGPGGTTNASFKQDHNLVESLTSSNVNITKNSLWMISQDLMKNTTDNKNKDLRSPNASQERPKGNATLENVFQSKNTEAKISPDLHGDSLPHEVQKDFKYIALTKSIILTDNLTGIPKPADSLHHEVYGKGSMSFPRTVHPIDILSEVLESTMTSEQYPRNNFTNINSEQRNLSILNIQEKGFQVNSTHLKKKDMPHVSIRTPTANLVSPGWDIVTESVFDINTNSKSNIASVISNPDRSVAVQTSSSKGNDTIISTKLLNSQGTEHNMQINIHTDDYSTKTSDNNSQGLICLVDFCGKPLDCSIAIPRTISHRVDITFYLQTNVSVQADIPKLFELYLRHALNAWSCSSVVRLSFSDGQPFVFSFLNSTMNENSACDEKNLDELKDKMFNDSRISDNFAKKFLPMFKIKEIKMARMNACIYGAAGISRTALAMLIVFVLSVIPCIALIVVKLLHAHHLRIWRKRHQDILRSHQPFVLDAEKAWQPHSSDQGGAVIEMGCRNYGYEGQTGDFK